MLKNLHIKNYALIEELRAEFGTGLNILTGETGAGKSIIVDALGLILGERAESEAVRKGADRAMVEGTFSSLGHKKLLSLLSENDIEHDGDLILRREVSAKGQSRCFINDSPVTLALMKEAGNLMVDLHGQHEHQSLLRPETHIDLLDEFGSLEGLRAEFHEAYRQASALLTEKESLIAQESRLREKQELYEFQIKEIDGVSPREGEEDELQHELKILENAEKLFDTTARLHSALYEGENAVHDQLVRARNILEDLAGIDKSFEESRNECASAVAIVQELAKFIQQYNSRVEFNPQRLEHIRERLGHLSLLKKKYGGSVDAIIAHRERIGREVGLAKNFDAAIAELGKRFAQAQTAVSLVAERLSLKRREAAKRVNKAIVNALAELGIQNAQFETRIERTKAVDERGGIARIGNDLYVTTPKGIDVVEFHISTNVGEDPKPLSKVASGGEISRIMLATKTILAKADRLPLLIFDEIDNGVSGRIAQVVGRSLKNLSMFHQIIAITHLPQIAALADVHFAVEKVEDGQRAYTRLHELDGDGRVRAVAALMSGDEVTRAGLAGARELMGLQ